MKVAHHVIGEEVVALSKGTTTLTIMVSFAAGAVVSPATVSRDCAVTVEESSVGTSQTCERSDLDAIRL